LQLVLRYSRVQTTGDAMARTNAWAAKVLALIQGGNTAAAVAQIKVAPGAQDVKALHGALAAAGLAGRWPAVDTAISDSYAALSAPRLHRAP
jgi:hypothetical protein